MHLKVTMSVYVFLEKNRFLWINYPTVDSSSWISCNLHFSTGVMWNSSLLAHQQMCCRVTLSPVYIKLHHWWLNGDVISSVSINCSLFSHRNRAQWSVCCRCWTRQSQLPALVSHCEYLLSPVQMAGICSLLPNFLLLITAFHPVHPQKILFAASADGRGFTDALCM